MPLSRNHNKKLLWNLDDFKYSTLMYICTCASSDAALNSFAFTPGTQCGSVECLNGGQCVNSACECIPPYSGDDCSMFNVCEFEWLTLTHLYTCTHTWACTYTYIHAHTHAQAHTHTCTHTHTHTHTDTHRHTHTHTHTDTHTHVPHCKQHNVFLREVSWSSSAFQCSFSFWLSWETPQMGGSPQHHETETGLHYQQCRIWKTLQDLNALIPDWTTYVYYTQAQGWVVVWRPLYCHQSWLCGVVWCGVVWCGVVCTTVR